MRDISSRNDKRHYVRSSSFKMALLFTILLGLSAGVLGYFSYYFTLDHFVSGAESLIDTENGYLTIAERQGTLPELLASAGRRAGHVYLLWDTNGRHLAGNLAALPAAATTLAEGTVLFEQRGRSYAAKIITFPSGNRLLTGIDITDSARSYLILQWLSLLSILFTALVVLVSFVISTFVVSRTNRIAETARDIMKTGDLSRRIAIDARWDDLGNMAYVLNTLLARVETLMQGIRSVSDNIAHDLRTPLTRLLNNLESLRRRGSLAADPELLAHCEEMIAEAARLLSTFNALLRIGSVETGAQRRFFAPVDLRRVVTDVLELYEPLAEEKGVNFQIVLSDMPPLPGDRDLLFQAIANLIDNAIKFTPTGGRVIVQLTQLDAAILLTVVDNGPGVAENDRVKVFDRFYRAEASRTTQGNGLGLSLVGAVVALHGGMIKLADAAPGLAVTITL